MKPQDVLVLLKMAAHPDRRFAQAELARELGMSVSEVNGSLSRSAAARLVLRAAPRDWRPVTPALLEFLVHGLRYVFPAMPGEIVRGMPTAWAAPPLDAEFARASEDLPPVWPDAEGSVRGQAVAPLYRSVPKAARQDPILYELLALVDAIRIGRARERESAVRQLRARLGRSG